MKKWQISMSVQQRDVKLSGVRLQVQYLQVHLTLKFIMMTPQVLQTR